MIKSMAVLAIPLFLSVAAPAHAIEAASLAERSGFLLGVALHCGVANARVIKVGKRMMAEIVAASQDAETANDATRRFGEFLVATSTGTEGKYPVRCDAVSAAFDQLERHRQ
jgi:hypothetical protein